MRPAMQLSKKHKSFRTGGLPVLFFILFFSSCVTAPLKSGMTVWESLPADEDVYISMEPESGMQLFSGILTANPTIRSFDELISRTENIYISLRASATGKPLFNIVAEGSYPVAGLEWMLAFNSEWQHYRGYKHRWIHKPSGIELTIHTRDRLYLSNVGNDHLYNFPGRDLPRFPDGTLDYFENNTLVGYFAEPGTPLLSVMSLFDKLPIEYFTAILDPDANGIQIELDIRLINRTAAIITRNLLMAGMKQLNVQGETMFFSDIEAKVDADHLYMQLSGINSIQFQTAIKKIADGYSE